jgi:hypothetical protein
MKGNQRQKKAKQRAKFKVLRIEKLAEPGVTLVELEVIGAPEPPAEPAPSQVIDLGSEPAPEVKGWWEWLTKWL